MWRAVERARAVVAGLTHRRLRDFVLHAAHEMPDRVAAQRVAGKQHDVHREDQRAEADAELDPDQSPDWGTRARARRRRRAAAGRARDVGEVAMDVLQNERERLLAEIRAARLADRARHGIDPERLVVGAAVVVAGEAEETRERQDQQRRRERRQRRPPCRLRSEPGVGRIAPQLGSIERGQIRAVGVVRVLERRPRGVDHEAAEDREDDHRLDPPPVAPVGLAEPTRHELDGNCLH